MPVSYTHLDVYKRQGMSPHLQQLTVLRHRTILTDVEVVADVIKPTGLSLIHI